jgi:hypothetical protein
MGGPPAPAPYQGVVLPHAWNEIEPAEANAVLISTNLGYVPSVPLFLSLFSRVKPERRCEVEFVERTKGGRLRHAEFRRLIG